jgi:hypothetical protein
VDDLKEAGASYRKEAEAFVDDLAAAARKMRDSIFEGAPGWTEGRRGSTPGRGGKGHPLPPPNRNP